jgi:Dynamin family
MSREHQLVNQAVDGLRKGRALAAARDRGDLASTLDKAEQRIDQRTIGVAVVGEFKRGKSTLVNALLHTAICPVDADEVTVVPTIIRYAETAGATAYFDATDEDGDPLTESIPVEAIGQYVSETGNPGNVRGLRSVEVRLPRRMLRTGLSLIDTPGVGGLDSAYGIITLGALDSADGVLFVCDASQELTQPELDFLRQALQRCPVAACVVTKTDLYPQWRKIVELNRVHLETAGIDIPVIAVSSFLRLGDRRDPALAAESGYPNLVDFLARTVVRSANAVAAASAAREIDFVAGQLGKQINAEKAVLTEPAAAERVVASLASDQGRTAGLISPTATWQQVLSDGVQDLVADVEHDLQGRLRTVLRDVEAIIEAGDPKDAWADIEVWLRRHVVAAAVENYDLLAARTRELAEDVGMRFNLDANTPVLVDPGGPPAGLDAVNLASAESLQAPGGKLAPMMTATRTALFVPMVLFGIAGSLLGAVVAAPLTALLAAGIGQKIIRDEKKRQIAHRRQQAKFAARRYVEEVGFIMNKEGRDALRRTQRLLRDDFQSRAMTLHRSSMSALEAAQSAAQLSGPDRHARVAQLNAEASRLNQVGAQVAQLAEQAPAAAGAGRG